MLATCCLEDVLLLVQHSSGSNGSSIGSAASFGRHQPVVPVEGDQLSSWALTLQDLHSYNYICVTHLGQALFCSSVAALLLQGLTQAPGANICVMVDFSGGKIQGSNDGSEYLHVSHSVVAGGSQYGINPVKAEGVGR